LPVLRDFKTVLMFYAEPFLKGVKIFQQEGESNIFAAQQIVSAIEAIKKSSNAKKFTGLNNLLVFYAALKQGIQIDESISTCAREADFIFIQEKAKQLQMEVVNSLTKMEYLVVPFSWIGHAICLTLRLNPKDKTVDLSIHNTGEGLNFHHFSPDPDGVYPFLNRTWISFKGIPMDTIFSDNPWFFIGLIGFKSFLSDKIMATRKNTIANYFYGSFLANFKDYLVPVDPSDDTTSSMHIPMQRSGSCTISSILAALLYHSGSAPMFHTYRMKIGHELIKALLANGQTDLDFKRAICDGFEGHYRSFFRGLSSNLAHQTLQYLESVLPTEFKGSSLLGPERSAWIYEKRAVAIRALKMRKDVTLSIQTSIRLSAEIFKFLKGHPITNDSTKLVVHELQRQNYFLTDNGAAKFTSMKLDASVFSNVIEHLRGGPSRHDLPIFNVHEIIKELKSFSKVEFMTTIMFAQIADIFTRAGPKWWILIDSIKDPETALDLLSSVRNVSRKLLSRATVSAMSFDDLALIAHLQLASWKAAVKYDNFSSHPIGLSNFNPPETIKTLLKDPIHHILATNTEKWCTSNIFSVRSIESLTAVLREFKRISVDGKSTFIGPEVFLKANIASFKIDYFAERPDLTYIHEMANNSIVAKLLKSKKKCNDMDQREFWIKASDIDAKLYLVLSSEPEIVQVFPHFYELMDTLTNIFFGPSCQQIPKFEFDSWTEPIFSYEWTVKLSIKPPPSNFDPVNASPFKIISGTRDSSVFYTARHSFALSRNTILITDIETWLNCIKAATSAKIFDNVEFVQTTDHLLNVPKYDEFDSDSMKFMIRYEPGIIKDVCECMIRLVLLSLNALREKQHRLNSYGRTKLVSRAANISILLTRFISRVDADERLPAKECAQLLARLYNNILDYADFQSDLELEEPTISKLNLVLCHICSIPLRNTQDFMEFLSPDIPSVSPRYRRTLEKYHWFAAKTNYSIDDNYGSALVDGQFTYGIVERPLCKDETGFLEALLKKFFLPTISGGGDNVVFKYHSSGFIVEVHGDKVVEPSTEKSVILNLATGAIVRYGLPIVTKSEFLNLYNFNSFFKWLNRSVLLSGIAVKAAGKSIYALPDVKGISYLVVKRQGDEEFSIHRKWNNEWYNWDPKHEFLKTHVGYQWTNEMKAYSRVSADGSNYKELLLFAQDEDKDPIVRLSIKSNKIGIEVKELLENDRPWIVNCKSWPSIERHISAFVENDEMIQFTEAWTSRLGVIYPGYRLPDDPSRPLTIIEESGTFDFKVLNVPGLMISFDQSLHDGSSLPGALIAVKDSSKRIMLLPLVENYKKKIKDSYRSRNPPEKKNLIEIQMIPVVEGGVPSPQSRIHRLLLAYYYILAQKYNLARELLHPSASLHQNEAYSRIELNIISWITRVDYLAPELLALKLLVLMLYYENESKFPLDHASSNYSNDCVNDILSAKDIAPRYLLSIREISEKFYIHRMYPDILRSSNMDAVFKTIHPPQNNKNIWIDYTEFCPVRYESDLARYHWTLGDSFNSVSFSGFVLKMYPDSISSIAKRFLIRSDASAHAEASDFAVFCYVSNPDMWDNFTRKYDFHRKTGFRSDFENFLSEEYRRNMDACYKQNLIEKFSTGIDQSTGSTATSIKTIQATMQADLNRAAFIIQEEAENNVVTPLVSAAEIGKIVFFKDKLEFLIAANASSKDVSTRKYFENNDNGTILKKLFESIAAFTLENGPTRLSEVNLSAELRKDLDEFDKHLCNRIKALRELQLEAEVDLLARTQKETYPSIISSLANLMHSRKPKTFSSLYTCYFGSYSSALYCIQRKFPALSLKACADLKIEAFAFFSRQILLDYYSLLYRFTQGFRKQSNLSVDDLTIFCDELDKISDFNARILSPVVMNFEFRSAKYRLKREQVKDIALLTSIDPQTRQFKSTVIQRMMAAGKTLVLGTISVVSKALKDAKLSILVPPSSLYQSNTTAMQSRTYQYFKKKGNIFSFPRFMVPSNFGRDSDHYGLRSAEVINARMLSKYLKTIKNLMSDTMQKKDYLILSPDSLHSFLNSYIEIIMHANDHRNKRYKETMQDYAWIYRTFKTQSSIILDEIDMIMDPRKELNFPTEESETYNMVAAAMLTDIMEFLLFDRNVIEGAKLDILSNNQASLTPENYAKCREMILDYIEGEFRDEGSIWYRLVFSGSRHKAEVDEIISFLRSPQLSQGRDLIDKFVDSKEEQLVDALIIVKIQLYQYMEDSLKGTVNHNFGSAGRIRPSIKYAVPYVAANTPSPVSVFADRWETLLKTLLMVSAVPCPKDWISDIIGHVRAAIVHESGGVQALESTATYKNMRLILPEGLSPVCVEKDNHLHVEAVWRVLSVRSPAAIRILYGYFMNKVFNFMTFPTNQITSNALHVASMFGSVQGYSGTIDNVNILPQVVVREAYQDHLRNEKNNGGIALKLMQDFDDCVVPELSTASFNKNAAGMIREMLDLYGDARVAQHLSAIIDTGAFFKNFTNLQVAHGILEVFSDRIEAVLFYNEDTNQLEFIRKSSGTSSAIRGFLDTTDPDDMRKATQTSLAKRFTFYDQRHTTGSDILQHKSAEAIMTAGPRILLRDLLQGALRMRQFMTSQRVHLITTLSTRLFYSSRIGRIQSVKVSDILTLGSLNEDDKQQHENRKLAFVKIDVEIRSFVLDEISRHLLYHKDQEEEDDELTTSTSTDAKESSCESFDFVNELIQCTRTLFLRSIHEKPQSWLKDSRKENSAELLKMFAVSRLNPLKTVINLASETSPSILMRFNALKGRILSMISEDRKNETDCLLHHLPEQIEAQIDHEIGNEVQLQTLGLSLTDVDLNQLTEEFVIKLREKEFIDDQLILEADQQSDSPAIKDSKASMVESFVSVYEVFRANSNSYQMYVNSALLTKGVRIGVSKDMVQLHQTDNTSKLYPIFSKYTLEASHMLIQVLPGNVGVRLILLSPREASLVLRDLHASQDLSSQFWLCDLAGRVTAASSKEKFGFGSNVLEFIPSVRELVFDALIFNGSLPQILNSPPLRTLYYDRWLSAENFKERATFLLLRMKVLMGKHKEMFEEDNEDYVKLKRYAHGDRNPSVADGYSEGYPKAPLEMTKTSDQLSAVDLDSVKVTFDLNKEIMRLFGIDSLKGTATESFEYNLAIKTTNEADVNLDNSELQGPVASEEGLVVEVPDYYEEVEDEEDEASITTTTDTQAITLTHVMDNEIGFDESMPESVTVDTKVHTLKRPSKTILARVADFGDRLEEEAKSPVRPVGAMKRDRSIDDWDDDCEDDCDDDYDQIKSGFNVRKSLIKAVKNFLMR
jgi:hypothetical protein